MLAIICLTCKEPYPCQSQRIAAAVYSDHPRHRTDPDTRVCTPTAVERLLVAHLQARRLRRNTDSLRTRLSGYLVLVTARTRRIWLNRLNCGTPLSQSDIQVSAKKCRNTGQRWD